MLARGAALLERAAAGGKGAALLMVDIDRFKAINDGYGHAVGDRVLKEVAARMAASCRGGDLLGRHRRRGVPRGLRRRQRRRRRQAIAERLREAVARPPVAIGGGSAACR